MDRTIASRLSCARCGGVVMVITLLAIILIASLLFYVYNVGTSVQGRVVTQHAADAAAIGGASQVARSMNTVAMNNVETTRLISAVNMLDSVPLAIDISITDASEEELGDVDALAHAVSAQVRAGVIDHWFDRKLREMIDPNSSDSVIATRDELRELDELFRSQPDLIPEMTWYRARSGKMGRMHQAMRSLDANSQAVMRKLGEAAQSAAARSSRANFGNDNPGDAGLLLPAAPDIPWQRGVFADFERPVKYGLLPGYDDRLSVDDTSNGLGQIDDELTNRGPFDAVFGWRILDDSSADYVPGLGGANLSTPSVRRIPPDEATSYEVGLHYNDWHRIMGGMDAFVFYGFPYGRYHDVRSHLRNIASKKKRYLWEAAPDSIVVDNAWEIDIEFDDERSSDRNSDTAYSTDKTIHETMFVVCEIKSRLINDPGEPNRQGLTWNYITTRQGWPQPYIFRVGGSGLPSSADADQLPRFNISPASVVGTPTWNKVQDHIWRLSAVYETDPEDANNGGDPSIGLPPKRVGTDPEGEPIYAAQEVHWELDFMLVGVNVGDEVVVINPWDGFDMDADDAPAPIDLVKEELPPNNAEARWDNLTFLGIARQSNRPGFWPTRFQGDKAYPYNTAIAQAHVFNNHSWDLWTQTWQAKLEPVTRTRFDDWVDRADEAAALAQTETAPASLDPEQASEMADHLRSIETLAPVMLNH
jgi:putative Flp pilus-assembly TadE/G-like protein